MVERTLGRPSEQLVGGPAEVLQPGRLSILPAMCNCFPLSSIGSLEKHGIILKFRRSFLNQFQYLILKIGDPTIGSTI